jgi:hypothetical protein
VGTLPLPPRKTLRVDWLSAKSTIKNQGCNEKVMIKVKVEEEAPKTREFIKYIFTAFIERFPLSEKEVIEIDLYEGKKPFPKIKEVSESYPKEKVVAEDANLVKAHIAKRAKAMDEWLAERFRDLFTISSPDGWHGEQLRSRVRFHIINPKRIYKECGNYGVLVPDENSIIKGVNPNVAEIIYNPTRILWKNQVISLAPATIQEDVCKYSFGKVINEIISWDEVADSIDKKMADNQEKGKDSIYNAVHDINKKIEKLCGEPLFKWENISFCRLA